MSTEVGKTKTSGYQFGIRRTVPVSAEEAWYRLFSPAGMKLWLGKGDFDNLQLDKVYETTDGISGRIRLIVPGSHIRMNWKKEKWPNDSILQIRIINKGNRSTISFHQEKLLDAEQRKEMKAFWEKKIRKVNALFS